MTKITLLIRRMTMISIPIWSFVMLCLLSFVTLVTLTIAILSYVKYCSYREQKTKNEVKKYGTKERK